MGNLIRARRGTALSPDDLARLVNVIRYDWPSWSDTDKRALLLQACPEIVVTGAPVHHAEIEMRTKLTAGTFRVSEAAGIVMDE